MLRKFAVALFATTMFMAPALATDSPAAAPASATVKADTATPAVKTIKAVRTVRLSHHRRWHHSHYRHHRHHRHYHHYTALGHAKAVATGRETIKHVTAVKTGKPSHQATIKKVVVRKHT